MIPPVAAPALNMPHAAIRPAVLDHYATWHAMAMMPDRCLYAAATGRCLPRPADRTEPGRGQDGLGGRASSLSADRGPTASAARSWTAGKAKVERLLDEGVIDYTVKS